MNLTKYLVKLKEVVFLNRDYVNYIGIRKSAYFFSLALITSFANSVNYVALIPLVSFVVDSSSIKKNGFLSSFFKLLPEGPNAIYVVGALVIAAFVVKFITNILFSHLAGKYSEEYMFHLRQEMMETMAKEYYESGAHSPSQMMHFNNMVTRVGSFNWASFSMVSKAISSAFLFVSLLLVELKFAAYSMLFVLFWAAILMPVLRFTRKIAAEYSESLRRVQIFLKDEVEGKEIIQIFGLAEVRAQRLELLKKEAVQGNAFLSDIRAVVANLQEFIVVVIGVILLCFASTYKLDIGFLVAYGYVFSKFISNLNEVSTYLNNALEVMPPTQEILIYAKPLTLMDESPLKSNIVQIREIEFRDICFSWSDLPLFTLLALRLKKGDRLLISGKNGVGKTTLLKVMAGLIRATGHVSVNGDETLPLQKLRDLHSKFSYLPQNGVVFEGSLISNIILNSGKTIDDIRMLSLELDLNLEDYFDNWENFQIHEDGNNLSGGEMQIISIYRALIRESEVLFVDEFTNHLSDKVAQNVDQYLGRQNDKIMVCVSHSKLNFPNRFISIADKKVTVES